MSLTVTGETQFGAVDSMGGILALNDPQLTLGSFIYFPSTLMLLAQASYASPQLSDRLFEEPDGHHEDSTKQN